MTERKILPGTIYTGSEDRQKYQVVTLAEEKATGRELVVYQTLFEPFTTYAEPLEVFLQLLENRESTKMAGKCEIPVEQFFPEEKAEEDGKEPAEQSTVDGEPDIHPMFRRFLDAKGHAERIEILKGMRDVVDNTMINSIAVILDMEIKEGPIGERYDELMECMHMKHRYEIERY